MNNPKLASILNKIDFPVFYGQLGIYNKDGRHLMDVILSDSVSDDEFEVDAFGEELARLINTLDPKRESEKK